MTASLREVTSMPDYRPMSQVKVTEKPDLVIVVNIRWDDLNCDIHEKSVLRAITEAWEICVNDELHAMQSSSDIIRVIKSTKLRGAGNLTLRRTMSNAYKISVRKYANITWEFMCRLEYSTKMGILKKLDESLDHMDLPQGRDPGRLMWTHYWILGFRKMRDIAQPNQLPLYSKRGLFSME
jgi:hypothetical protein